MLLRRPRIGVPGGWCGGGLREDHGRNGYAVQSDSDDSVFRPGDRASTLTGPGGMSGAVIIAATDLEPGGAFLKYAVDMRDSRPGVKFTVTAAQFCGHSGQQLAGTFQNPSGTFDFADRLTHIWTNTKKYLVAIQLQGPVGAGRIRCHEINVDAGIRRRHTVKTPAERHRLLA
jgi:hypothetical protein